VLDARKLFDTVFEWGILTYVWSYNILIIGYWKCKRLDEALSLFDEMHRKNLVPNIVTFIVLLLMVCANLGGSLVHGNFLVQSAMTVQHNVIITYNILIDAFCKILNFDMGISLFVLMFERGLTPTVSTYNILIK
jgi:pentatricopeptide repeat domain-containing protein 1